MIASAGRARDLERMLNPLAQSGPWPTVTGWLAGDIIGKVFRAIPR
jgi:hypothetical protein